MLITTVKRKKIAKNLHAWRLEPETFHAADAHATNRLRIGKAASIALFMERLDLD